MATVKTCFADGELCRCYVAAASCILSCTYGKRDVTAHIKSLVENRCLDITISPQLFDDCGTERSPVLEIHSGSPLVALRKRTLVVSEGARWRQPLLDVHHIVRANYGTDAHHVDVMARLRAHAQHARAMNMLVTNATMGGDPAPNVQKRLHVHLYDRPELHILVLIIASHDTTRYRKLHALWKDHLRRAPANITCRFIVSDPAQRDEVCEDAAEHTLVVRQHESYIPGIYNKTIAALTHMLARENTYGAVVRTNLSTFWNWDRLNHIVSDSHAHRFQPNARPLYTGCPVNSLSPANACSETEQYDLSKHPVPFVSGTTIVLNRAAAHLLAKVGSKHMYYSFLHTIDDVLIAWVLDAHGIKMETLAGISWLSWPDTARSNDLHDARNFPAFRTRGASLEATYYRMLVDQYLLYFGA